MSKVEQRPVIGIVPTRVPDEDIVRVYGPDGLVEAIEVRDRTFMMGVQWHPEYFAGGGARWAVSSKRFRWKR